MVLVTIVAVVFFSITAAVVLLVCVTVKCTKTRKMSVDETIQTSANVCYEEMNVDLTSRYEVDNNSLHLYDDIMNLKSSTEQDYENVDPATDLPMIPQPTGDSERRKPAHSHDSCERACLPLKTIQPAKLSTVRKFQRFNKDQVTSARAHTLKHKLPESQKILSRRVSMPSILEAADYEIPTPNITITAV